MIKGIVLDYNGTMYFDGDLHNIAWKAIYEELAGTSKGFDEFLKTNNCSTTISEVKEICKRIGKDLNEEEILYFSDKKEIIYRNLAKEQHRDKLSPGCEEAMVHFLEKGLKVTIYTASMKENVDFYFENTKLDRWFEKENIIYDEKDVQGKKEIYKKVPSIFGIPMDECIVFEDQDRSIKEGIKAGFKKFIRINSSNLPPIKEKEVIMDIKDFTELDYSKFDELLL